MTAPGIAAHSDVRVTGQSTKRRFLTIEQAIEELNVKESLIRSLINTGELRALQVGGRGYVVGLLGWMTPVAAFIGRNVAGNASFLLGT